MPSTGAIMGKDRAPGGRGRDPSPLGAFWGTLDPCPLLCTQLESRQLQPVLGHDAGGRDPVPPGHLPTLSHRHEHERDARESPQMEGETEARYGLSLPVPWLHPVLSPSPSASNVPAVSPTPGKGLCSRGRGGGGREGAMPGGCRRQPLCLETAAQQIPPDNPRAASVVFSPVPPCRFPIGKPSPQLLSRQSRLRQRFASGVPPSAPGGCT